MLKKNQFVKILLVNLLSLLSLNIFCSSTLELMNRSDDNYYPLERKIIYTNLNLYNKLLTTKEKTQSSIIKGQEGSGIKIITEGDNVFISLDSKSIEKMLSNAEKTPPTDIQTEINKQYDKYIKEKILPANQKRILSIIKDLAPELHEKITKFDPDGSQHIIAGNGLGIRSITHDGLPIIEVDDNFINESFGSQKALIAHELGHYALEHLIIKGTTYDEESGKIFNKKNVTTKDDSIKIKYSNGLDSSKAMTDGYVRTYEYEADRFAMINMGIDYQDVEAMIKEMNDSTKGRTTFKLDHPLDQDRLKQFQAIKTEMELLKNSSVKAAPIDWDQIQYDTLKYKFYNLYDHIYKDSPISSREEDRTNFETAVKKYLPNMLSKAETEMNEIALAHSNQKKESLSTKDWVNVHKFLLQINNSDFKNLKEWDSMIEKLQACGSSCIKKGSPKFGFEIIQNEDLSFSIILDEATMATINDGNQKDLDDIINKIKNSFSPSISQNKFNKSQISSPNETDIQEKTFENFIQENNSIQKAPTVGRTNSLRNQLTQNQAEADPQEKIIIAPANHTIKNKFQPIEIETNSNSAINSNKALDLNDGIDFSNQSLNIQQGTEAQDVNDVKDVFSNNLKVNLQTPNNSMNFSDRFKQAFQKAAESTANVFKYSKGLAAQAVANIKSLASQVYRLTPSDIAQAIKSSPSNLLNAVQSIISKTTNNTNSNNLASKSTPQSQFIINQSSQKESATETKKGNTEDDTENSDDITIRNSDKAVYNSSNKLLNPNSTSSAKLIPKLSTRIR